MMPNGIIFLDKHFEEVTVDALYTPKKYEDFIHEVHYIFIDDECALQTWNHAYTHNENKTIQQSPFKKTGAYMWDENSETWVHLWDAIEKFKELIGRIVNKYLTKQFLEQHFNVPTEEE